MVQHLPGIPRVSSGPQPRREQTVTIVAGAALVAAGILLIIAGHRGNVGQPLPASPPSPPSPSSPAASSAECRSPFAVHVPTATMLVSTGIRYRAVCSVVVDANAPMTTGPTT